MYWESSVDELQRFGPVVLHRADARWYATWQVLVWMPDRKLYHWPVRDGMTPADAVKVLWGEITTQKVILVADRFLQLRWNGVWISEVVNGPG